MRPGNMSEPGDRIHLDLPLAAGVAVHSLPPLDAQAGLFVYGLIKFHGAAARHRARDQHTPCVALISSWAGSECPCRDTS